MPSSKIVTAGLSVLLSLSAFLPVEAQAQYGGSVLGGMLGGVIAGAIVAGSRPQTVYVYSRRPSAQARSRGRHYAAKPKAGAKPSPATAAINTASDPFAGSSAPAPITVSSKP